MKKKVKSKIINWGIILIIITGSLIYLNSGKTPETSEEIAKCIGEKSTLYTQLGCSHCGTQEKIFGENYYHLDIIDCFYEIEKCQDISATPTWKIKNKHHTGIKSIEELQSLTGC